MAALVRAGQTRTPASHTQRPAGRNDPSKHATARLAPRNGPAPFQKLVCSWRRCPFPTRYMARYSAAISAACAPSDTAVTTWRRLFVRTSPAANTPGTLVCPLSSART